MKKIFSYMDIAYSNANSGYGESETVNALVGNPDSWRVRPGPTGGWLCR